MLYICTDRVDNDPINLTKGAKKMNDLNKYPETDAEIEDAIAEGELRQERELSQAYEDAGWREAEQEDAYNRDRGIY